MKFVKTFESYESLESEISQFIDKQRKKDQSEYTGDIKTKYNPGSKWDDEAWLVTELMQFLSNNYTSSYILRKFGNKSSHEELSGILKALYPTEFDKAEQKQNNQ